MSILWEALRWLATPANWVGESGILARSAEHLGLTLLIVALATLVALPVGTWIGHTGRGRWLVGATGGARAVPTLGVLTLAGLWLGGPAAAVGDVFGDRLDAACDGGCRPRDGVD